MEYGVLIESKLDLLEMLFGQTFLSTTRKNYLIEFENSNVVDEMEILNEFFTQLLSSAPTKKNKKDLNHLTTLIDTYTFLISEYKNITRISHLPSNLKRQVLFQYLRKHIKTQPINPKELLIAAIKEVNKPVIVNVEKLTPTQIADNNALIGFKRRTKPSRS
ncbi:hypothetical protein H9X96_17470 [Pedobacter sp. N36a]|uniref:hypothetical protein n=1 Tax=Pedobacter sp. N36a TaxID=2767996 RepID=UPI001656D441|nr:hypothetical protein [Pedobacter sp. N36a]MBC8987562.1 hypothetical protein [Pedobacter sp. N36a]